MTDAAPLCVRCGRPIEVNRALYADVFERMHWLCFHLEFEHPGDPDAPCTDAACYVWQLEVYQQALRDAGVDPDAVMNAAITRRYA